MSNRQFKIRLYVTNIIIFATTLVYILDKYVLLSGWDYYGTDGVASKILGLCGGDVFAALCYDVESIAEGEWWRVITFLFPHVFLLHFAVNMLALYKTGNVTEEKIGGLWVLVLFFAIGIADQLLTDRILSTDNAAFISGGASGSVFGFIGLLIAFSLKEKGFVKSNFKLGWIIFLALYGVLFTYPMGIWTIVTHNLGVIIGFAAGMLLKPRKKATEID